ncbi:Txe/YoeB family addiction module toxin [Facklamia sp. Marseille-P5643]|uniref:Txe/YoeB family addiction module toxin n=1 Tax=Vaginisenegalia massiliensis TaxID=2058294 RepID=UPI000F522D8E
MYKTLENNPYEHSQSFEKLFPKEQEFYSRRINIIHRVVYKIDEENKLVIIYSAWTHYALE